MLLTARRKTGRLLTLAVLATAVLLSSCGGGGGGGGGGALIAITADGASEPLWSLVNGVPSVPAACPIGAFVNGRIVFTFDGPVDPASVPGGPFALGSLNVVQDVTGIPARGTFAVEDDPSGAAGNHRRVVFTPALPSDPASPCSGGVDAFQNYQVSVPFGTSSPFVIVVGSEPIQDGAVTCFRTCGCPSGGGCAAPFFDAVPGAPFIVSTTPATADPAPSPIDLCSLGGAIEILISEPLDPSGITLMNVRVTSYQLGAVVPGSLVFHQASQVDGMSRIDFVPAQPLAGNTTFQVFLDPAIHDFGGNPIQPAQLFFQTSPVASTPQPPLVESFDSANPAGVTGVARWTGDGALELTFPIELTGTGADGAFNPGPGMVVLNTNEPVAGVSRKGVWNFTDFNIPATTTVRLVGPYQAHLRCTGSVNVNGWLDASAAMGPATSLQPYDQGPDQGYCCGGPGGSGPSCEAKGGTANAGGGAGGTGSGITPPPGSPPLFQCGVRTLVGENGFGPPIDGVVNTGSPPNPHYAGGQGGDSGCFPSISGPDCVPGDLGGLGGAGGTGARIGEAGLPRLSTSACTPTPGVIQPIAQPSPVAPAMIPPVALQSAGSGGGGGGDHLDNIQPAPNADDEGAGGGGGGGGIRVSCAGSFTIGPSSVVRARGTAGQTAQVLGGGGGSGSGGEVWIQSFSTVSISATSIIDVTGPARFGMLVGFIGCSNQAAGGGGAGLVQIEAGQGPVVAPSFNLMPTPTATTGAVFTAPPFVYAAGIAGQGKSGFRFAASSPDYTGVVEVATLGNAAGAVLSIRYEGAHEAVTSTPGSPIHDPATIKSTTPGGAPITAANLDELDGYAFIQFVVDLSAPNPPATAPNAVLPSVDSITINFNAEPGCP